MSAPLKEVHWSDPSSDPSRWIALPRIRAQVGRSPHDGSLFPPLFVAPTLLRLPRSRGCHVWLTRRIRRTTTRACGPPPPLTNVQSPRACPPPPPTTVPRACRRPPPLTVRLPRAFRPPPPTTVRLPRACGCPGTRLWLPRRCRRVTPRNFFGRPQGCRRACGCHARVVATGRACGCHEARVVATGQHCSRGV